MTYHGTAETVEYELTEGERAVLLEAAEQQADREVGIASVASEPANIATGGVFPTRRGNRIARASVKYVTRPMTAAATADVPEPPETVIEHAKAAFAAHGRPIENPNGADDGSVWGIVGTGMGGLAPALVRVAVEPSEPGSRVEIRGSGMEGLVKGHVGAKGADKILAEL